MAAPPWSFASTRFDPGVVMHEDARRDVPKPSMLGSLREKARGWAERLERLFAEPRALT